MNFSPRPPAPEGLSFVELPQTATIEVRGADRLSWLNGLVTCNLAPLKPGEGAYGLSASKVGKILADLWIVIEPDRLLLGCPAARLEALTQSFESYLIMEDVELRDASAEHGWLLVHGRGALAAAREAAAGLGTAAGVHFLGEDAVVVTAQKATAAGRLKRGAEELTEAAWDKLRLEAGVPRFGVDFDEKTYPQEAALERRAVSFCKGCYLGQEVICRLEMRGHVHRRLAPLDIDATEAPERGAEVKTPAGEVVGAVTSAAYSPRLGRAVALAMVKYAQSQHGERLRVGEAAAEVAALGAPA